MFEEPGTSPSSSSDKKTVHAPGFLWGGNDFITRFVSKRLRLGRETHHQSPRGESGIL